MQVKVRSALMDDLPSSLKHLLPGNRQPFVGCDNTLEEQPQR
jgi:hypothetical protein